MILSYSSLGVMVFPFQATLHANKMCLHRLIVDKETILKGMEHGTKFEGK